jgi:hypothetical protein
LGFGVPTALEPPLHQSDPAGAALANPHNVFEELGNSSHITLSPPRARQNKARAGLTASFIKRAPTDSCFVARRRND